MKKQLLGAGLILTALLSSHAFAEDNISVTFDSKALSFDTPPQMVNGSVMVPMRKIFETIGADVKWDGETKTVTAIKNAQYVKFTADNVNIELGVCKDGKNTGELLYYADGDLNSAPLIVNGSMLVPARAVSEAFYYDVNWDADNKQVEITTPDNDEGWIYYSSWTDGGHMYKIDTNGQNRQILSENDCYTDIYRFTYDDGYIYYSVRGENEGCLYRIKTDGTGEEKLTDIPVNLEYDFKTRSAFIGDCIYFCKSEKDNRDYTKYTVPFYKLNIKTKELTRLFDKDITSYSIRKYGDYIYFQYYDDRMSYYRLDGNDGSIIKVLDNTSTRNFSIENDDRLHFINERDGKPYTAALDGSDVQETEEDNTSKLIEKYNYDGILNKSDDFFVAYRLTEPNYEEDYMSYFEYYIVDNEGNELFKITPPENGDIHHGAEISGRKVYYSVTPKYKREYKKLYVDSLDELLGMQDISVSKEKINGKYEILTDESEIIKNDFESEIHCIDLDKNIDTVILKGYILRTITAIEKDKLYLIKADDSSEYYYTADLDGSNIEPYQPSMPSLDTIIVKEDARYGIIVKDDGTVKDYPNFNTYWKNKPYSLDY